VLNRRDRSKLIVLDRSGLLHPSRNP
jgi:hypothetical protein